MIEYDVLTRLLAVSAVTNIVGSGSAARAWVATLPQDATFPALTITVVSGAPFYDMDGQSGIADVRLQIDCWAHAHQETDDAYDDARKLGEAVRSALSGFAGTSGSSDIQSSFLQNRRVIYESEVEMYREIQDWLIGYAET